MASSLRWTEAEVRRYHTKRGQPLADRVPVQHVVRSRRGQTPQQILQAAVEERWPGRFVAEYEKLVPGRKFRADLCCVQLRLCIECDGWVFHGKHLASFHHDRTKDYLLTLNQWVVLRIPAGLIRRDIGAALTRVAGFIALQEAKGYPLKTPRKPLRKPRQ